MTLTEATEICEAWFAHLDRQRERSIKVQKLAALARTDGPEARRQLAEIDRTPVVFDASKLEPAVRFLLRAAGRENERE